MASKRFKAEEYTQMSIGPGGNILPVPGGLKAVHTIDFNTSSTASVQMPSSGASITAGVQMLVLVSEHACFYKLQNTTATITATSADRLLPANVHWAIEVPNQQTQARLAVVRATS